MIIPSDDSDACSPTKPKPTLLAPNIANAILEKSQYLAGQGTRPARPDHYLRPRGGDRRQ
jgi:hypothetical protein